MAKKANAPICDRCETPFRSASSYCPGCGGPTQWASHDERVQWEVRQWRASRASSEGDPQQMMLVRTDAGYQPMAVARYNEYVWDQPLHPEREKHDEVAVAPSPPLAAAIPAVVERRVIPPAAPNGNGNGAGHVVEHRPVEPAPVAAEPAHAEAPSAPPRTEFVEKSSERVAPDDRVTISKKAVALAIVLVLGLPFGGKLVGLVGGSSEPKTGAIAGPAKPAALVAARSGFAHVGPDAVRYAVVIKNPNKGFQASGVTVNVVLHDAKGRLVGRDTESLTAIPAAGVTGIAGAVGVSGAASRLTVSVGGATFEETTPAKPFIVRDVRLSRSDGSFVVRASISGVVAVDGARVVAVHLDRSGKVVGGDFTFLDVPRAPGSATAVISTAGVPRSVVRVEVYVLPR
ncbi:MAG: hypothetical protein ACRDJ1_12580 [Actinomycetota bacterium]